MWTLLKLVLGLWAGDEESSSTPLGDEPNARGSISVGG